MRSWSRHGPRRAWFGRGRSGWSPSRRRRSSRGSPAGCSPARWSASSSRARRTPTTACSAPSWPGRSRAARIYEGAPEGDPVDVLAELSFNGGSVAGQGFGAFNAWGAGGAGRGRRPGRRRQDDAGRHRLDPQGHERRGAQDQRVGGQVVRLRRPAWPPVRPGVGRLALLHPPLGSRRGAGGRARRAPGRLTRLHRRPGQRQGLRLRVHDGRAAPSCSATSARGRAPG